MCPSWLAESKHDDDFVTVEERAIEYVYSACANALGKERSKLSI